MPLDSSLSVQTIRNSGPLVIEDARAHPEYADLGTVVNDPHVHFYMGVPLIYEDGQRLGALEVMHSGPFKPAEFQTDTLCRIARQVMTLLELRKARVQLDHPQILIEVYEEQISAMRAEISNLSRTDELTGLWNRKSLVHELGRELSCSRRSGSTFAVLSARGSGRNQIEIEAFYGG